MAGKGLHQNIERATLVLSALAEGSSKGLRFAEVTKATELGKATTHRLLAGLVAHGLAEKDEATGRYFLGVKIASWAAAACNRFGIAERTAPALARLCQGTEDTVYLSICIGNEAVCLHRCEGNFPIKTLTLKVGDRRPLGIGAGSMALLAFLPDENIDAIISAQADDRASFGIDEITLRGMIDTAREFGYALNDEKIIPGMSAVGVPIHGEDGNPVAAISVAAISSRMEQPRRDNIVAMVRQEIRKIEADLRPVLTSGFNAWQAGGGEAR